MNGLTDGRGDPGAQIGDGPVTGGDCGHQRRTAADEQQLHGVLNPVLPVDDEAQRFLYRAGARREPLVRGAQLLAAAADVRGGVGDRPDPTPPRPSVPAVHGVAPGHGTAADGDLADARGGDPAGEAGGVNRPERAQRLGGAREPARAAPSMDR